MSEKAATCDECGATLPPIGYCVVCVMRDYDKKHPAVEPSPVSGFKVGVAVVVLIAAAIGGLILLGWLLERSLQSTPTEEACYNEADLARTRGGDWGDAFDACMNRFE